MRSAAAGRNVSRVLSSGDDHAVRVALMLTLPTIGLEQLLHTDRWTLAALPVYQALHWLSDSLLALPLAGGAVWGGQRLALRLGLDASTPQGIVGRAGLIPGQAGARDWSSAVLERARSPVLLPRFP